MARGTANTCMRDFYDIHIILHQDQIDSDVMCKVFPATSQKRKSQLLILQFDMTLDALEKVRQYRRIGGIIKEMHFLWENYLGAM